MSQKKELAKRKKREEANKKKRLFRLDSSITDRQKQKEEWEQNERARRAYWANERKDGQLEVNS